MDTTAKILAAAEFIRSRVTMAPTVGLVLGSGLGDYSDTLEDAVRIPYSEIPNFPVPSIPGHAGALVFGRKMGKEVVVMQGRIHFYEGLPQQVITLPVRVLAAIGVKQLVLTNAAGGVNLTFGLQHLDIRKSLGNQIVSCQSKCPNYIRCYSAAK